MNIWFVSIFENTPLDDNQNTRYNCLVHEAQSRGHNVTFWASTFKHNEKKQRYDKTEIIKINELVTLRFIKTASYQDNISLRRLRSHHKFARDLVREFNEQEEKPDLIVNAFPPISSAYEVSKWAVQNDIPFILDIIDPWPDVFKSHIKWIPEFVEDFLLKPLKKKVSVAVQNASAVIGISNQYIDWANSYSENNKVSRCYYPAVQFDKMQVELESASKKMSDRHSTTGKKPFEVIYAGSLGHSYDIDTILGSAALLEEKYGDDVHFTIAGDGPQKDKVEQYQGDHNNLTYVGRVPKAELMSYYYRADMGMTQHIKGATQSVTYKLFDLLACGLPIFNSLESEMKDIILKNHVGLHNAPGDAGQLAENIIYCCENQDKVEQMKNNATRLTKELGDSRKVYSEALTFFETFQLKNNGVQRTKEKIYT